MKRIVLAGGSGFLGQVLADHFQNNGYEVINLTRSPKPGSGKVREVRWNARDLGEWARELEGATAVINLTGRSVNCRYTPSNRQLILESRVLSTRVLGTAISQCKESPRAWLNSSTATIYKHTYGPAWDESGIVGGTPEAKDAYSVEVALAWEQALQEARVPATRKIALRSAMVLGNRKNSVFPVLQKLAQYGLGGKMGTGKQFVSWIHEADFCAAIDWLIAHEKIDGAVNVAAPNPVTNAEMMKLFRNQCHQRLGLPANRWMLEIGAFFLRTETELILKSRRVIPKRLIDTGFTYRFSDLKQALNDLIARKED
jgi:uncharacterized protein (TIGR01777 family)